MKLNAIEFGKMLATAGLSGLPFTWDDAGNFNFASSMTAAQIAGVESVRDAYDDRSAQITIIWEQIKVKRDQCKVGGVKVKVGGVDKWFHSDDASRIQQMSLVMMGAGIPANLQWKTLDGSFVTMTQAVAQSVFAAAAASDQAIFGVAEAHRVALQASADPAAYDYLTGWPAIFGE